MLAIGAAAAALVALGQWASHANQERDAGITWTWAYSPRTLQTYLVRAKSDQDLGTIEFRLENGDVYQFTNCRPPRSSAEDDERVTCSDQRGNDWDLSLD